MAISHHGRVPEPDPENDLAVVAREYATEDHFLARRLTTAAELEGPLVEDHLIRAVAVARPRRVLDVGCGTGDVTQRLRDECNAEVVGVDLSPRMVQLTRARGIVAHVANIEALPFADADFDAVVANRVLYHVPDLARGLAELARVLRPGGRLAAVTYSDRHLHEVWGRMRPAAHPPLPFSAESGAAALRERFGTVERRDVTGVARFATVDALRRFFDSYGEFATFSPADVSQCLDGIDVPFDATYEHCLFIAG